MNEINNLRIEQIDHITVVYLSGQLNALTVPAIETRLRGLLRTDGHLIIDMADVKFMSSIGLWLLFSLQKELKGKNGKLVLVDLSDAAQSTLSLVGFESVARIFPSLDVALGFINHFD